MEKYAKEAEKEERNLILENARYRVLQAIKLQRMTPRPKDNIATRIGYKRALEDMRKIINSLPF